MSNRKTDAISKVRKIWDRNADKARSEMVDSINKDQYQDELEHKIEVYDGVKDTLKLCETMIKALDTTTSFETGSRGLLLSNLELARQYALVAATDVQIEKMAVRK